MIDLTMGQRIAARRKMAGMSQEALAAQLEVSRQAISKWESDASVPEVDKLIALGRIFGVSVGWILGTEPECGCDAVGGEHCTQTEQVGAQCHPKKAPLWKRAAAMGCVLTMLAGMGWLAIGQANAQIRLDRLTRENQQLRERVENLAELLESQKQESGILADYGIRGYASEDLNEVNVTLALTPKVYREGMKASLHITGPEGYDKTLDCRWDGAEYLIRVTLPAADGYRFLFRLTGEELWEEEDLNALDPGLGALKSLMSFDVDQSDSSAQLLNGSYTFDAKLLAPRILPKSAFAYQSVELILRCNGEVIQKMNYKDAFRNCTLPVPLKLTAELPELAEGDALRLELRAVLTAGQELLTVLDERIVE